jgi:hypothetical protein
MRWPIFYLEEFLYISLIILWIFFFLYFQILLLSHLRGCVRFEIMWGYPLPNTVPQAETGFRAEIAPTTLPHDYQP